MERIVIIENITHYKEQLRGESDPEKRHILNELLAAEEEKLRHADTARNR